MDYHASLKALDEEITKLSAAFASANEALGRITYLAGNLKRVEADKADASKKRSKDGRYVLPGQDAMQYDSRGIAKNLTGTNDLGNKPEVVQSVSVGSGKATTYKEMVEEILKRSRFDIPKKYVKFRPFEDQDGTVFLEISISAVGGFVELLGAGEIFSIPVESVESMTERFDDNVEFLSLARFPEKKPDHHEWERL